MALALPSNSKTQLEKVSKDKKSSLFDLIISNEGKSFITFTPGVSVIKPFSLLLMMRPNKLEGLFLETFSSQVLEFEGKARANPMSASQMLPSWVRYRCYQQMLD